jgi:hypothetical protein
MPEWLRARSRERRAEDTPPESRQAEASAWDVVVLSFKLLFQRIQFWIRPNLLSVLLSLPVVTAPGARAALYHTVAAGLRDPAGSQVGIREEMKAGFSRHVWPALLLAVVRLASLTFIFAALYFWLTREHAALRFVSILVFYGFVMWWLASGHLYPVRVARPEASLTAVVGEALTLAFRRPFASLLFSVVSSLLHILGLVLLGPVMFVIPALRGILHIQGYWFLTGQVVPGFLPVDVYVRQHTDVFNER